MQRCLIAWVCAIALAVTPFSRGDDDDDAPTAAPAPAAKKSDAPPAVVVSAVAESSPVTIVLGARNSSGLVHQDFEEGASTLSLSKIGSGTVTLIGKNSFSGGVTVSGGVLSVGPTVEGDLQTALGKDQVNVKTGAFLRFDDPQNGESHIYNDITLDNAVLDCVAGNPHFERPITVGTGGASIVTRAQGSDVFIIDDISGAGNLRIDNYADGSGGAVRINNDLSIMGVVTIAAPSPGFSGGKVLLNDPFALNSAVVDVRAGMRGIEWAQKIKLFAFGGLQGDANIDLAGKVLRAGIRGIDTVYSGAFTDSVGGGRFLKSGAGVLTLTGKTECPDMMGVLDGTLVMNGAVAGELKVGDPKIPRNRAVLMGTGTLSDLLLQTPGARVQPGSPETPGALTVRNFSMNPGSTLAVRLGPDKLRSDGSSRIAYDQIHASGQFSLYGNLEVTVAPGTKPKPGDALFILVTTGTKPVLGRFANFTSDDFTASGQRFRVNYRADSASNDPASSTGHDVALIALDPE